MTLFWIICALLLIVAAIFFVLPLWRASANSNDVLRDAANLEILRDQSVELENDLRNGLLTQEAYEQGKRELQARLLDEVQPKGGASALVHHPARKLAIALVVLLPLVAIPLYLTLGKPQALMPQEEPALAAGFGTLRSEAAIQELEKKMERLPENPDGWLLLASSYVELERYDDAVRCYANLVKLVPNEAQIWADYANARAMTNNQSLLGEPTKFLDKAVALDGNNASARALSGSAAMERGDYAAAVTHWQKLLELLPPDYPGVEMIQQGLAQAKEFLSLQPGGKQKLARIEAERKAGASPQMQSADPALAISGKVTLVAALAGKVSPDDTLFILARAAEGPKMPLAVLRKQVKDLPLAFTLDDSMAMQPQLKLSGFDRVVVVARISKAGSPMAQPGDLEGSIEGVKPGDKQLDLRIDQIVK